MRFDKLTTKFQQALADAQSLAARNDHPYIEPAHVLSRFSPTARVVQAVFWRVLAWRLIACNLRWMRL